MKLRGVARKLFVGSSNRGLASWPAEREAQPSISKQHHRPGGGLRNGGRRAAADGKFAQKRLLERAAQVRGYCEVLVDGADGVVVVCCGLASIF